MDEKALYTNFIQRLYTNIFIKSCKTYSQRHSLDVKFLSLSMCQIVYSPFQEAAIDSPILYFISTLST